MTGWIVAVALYLLGALMAAHLHRLMRDRHPEASRLPQWVEAALWPAIALVGAFVDGQLKK